MIMSNIFVKGGIIMKMNEMISTKRKELNMTQREMAEKLNVSDKSVSRWEKGSNYPDMELIPKIALVLGIDINELFGENELEKYEREEKYDYSKITKYKGLSIIALFTTLLSIVIGTIGLGGIENENLSIIMIIVSICVFFTGLTLYIIAKVSFKNYYSNKYNQDEYVNADIKNSFIYFLPLLFILGLLFLVLNIPYIWILMILNPVATFFFSKRYLRSRSKKIVRDRTTINLYTISILLFIINMGAAVYINYSGYNMKILMTFIVFSYLPFCLVTWTNLFRFTNINEN